MFNDLIDELNRLMNDKRIKIYETTNNDAKYPLAVLCEGLFRTTSGLITRTDTDNIINYNFKLDFAVPVDDVDLRLELENKIRSFRIAIDNLRFKNYRVLPSTEVAVGNEYSYRNKKGEFHDYVTYYIVGVLEENNVFIGMEGVSVLFNNLPLTGILSVVPTYTNNVVKNTRVTNGLKNEFKSNDIVRAWTITLNASNNESCKAIYNVFASTQYLGVYPFSYVWKDNNANELLRVETNVVVVNIDIAQTYGLISGITLKVVESL